MCYYEKLNLADRRAERKMANQSAKIHNALKGQLSCTTEEWLRGRKKQ